MSDQPRIRIEPLSTNGQLRARVAVTRGEQVIAMDEVNLGAQRSRREVAEWIAPRIDRPVDVVERQLIDFAYSQATQGAAPNTPLASPTDPNRLANVVREQYRRDDGACSLVHHQDAFFVWDGRNYRERGGGEFRAETARLVQADFDGLAAEGIFDRNGFTHQVSRRLVTDVQQALASLVHLNDSIDLPTWLCNPAPTHAKDTLVFANGILDLAGWIAGETNCFRSPTASFFTRTALDFDYSPNATCPCWQAFLCDLGFNDQGCGELLQDWFGYCLDSDTTQQKMLLLIGPPRSGKSIVSRTLCKLVGVDNFVAPTLQVIQSEFGLQPFVDKKLAVIPDARLSNRSNRAAIIERLLSITGEDSLTVNRKNKPMITTKLGTRIMMVTNELPDLKDASSAFTNRLLILPTTRSFLGRENPRLADELREELPGIFLCALEGLRRLRQRGHFIAPESSRELADEMRVLASPIQGFLDEFCAIDTEASVRCNSLYQAWRGFCEDRNLYDRGDAQFGKDLRAALPQLRKQQVRDSSGRSWRYVGVRLRRFDEPHSIGGGVGGVSQAAQGCHREVTDTSPS